MDHGGILIIIGPMETTIVITELAIQEALAGKR